MMSHAPQEGGEQAALRLLRKVPGVLCTIMNVEGSFSRSPGAQLAISDEGRFAGSLSDGCLERELASQAVTARSAKRALTLRYGAGSPIIDFRLPCGAGVDVLIDPLPGRMEIERVCSELDARRSASLPLPAAGNFEAGIRWFDPALRLLAFGKGPELSAITRLAEAAGIEVDARVAGAPGLALGRPPSGCTADAFTAIVLLFHDHEWEEQILLWALTTEAFYIGSIGGSLARRKRVDTLSRLGADRHQICRVRSPIGTIPSTRDPTTLAVSIVAEIVGLDQERRQSRPRLCHRSEIHTGGGSRMTAGTPLIDPFGRVISYLRLSLTDRCNLRCVYCLPERAEFSPRSTQLSIDELERLANAFVRLGIRKLRLTGGEPLVRKGALDLIGRLGRHVAQGSLEELTLTTNGLLLRGSAAAMAAAGVRRVNVSVDHLDPEQFSRITRGGHLSEVLAGIEAARDAGIEIKINTVVLKDDNLASVPDLVAWAFEKGITITLIEVMPIGEIGADRQSQHVSMPTVRAELEKRWHLTDVPLRTGGPARYAVTGSGARIGFITPLSSMFCDGCNRIRVGSDGILHACLGRDVATDLKIPLRTQGDDRALDEAIRGIIAAKPKSHDFNIAAGAAAAVRRPMAATGG